MTPPCDESDLLEAGGLKYAVGVHRLICLFAEVYPAVVDHRAYFVGLFTHTAGWVSNF